jgi:hypothetical protein
MKTLCGSARQIRHGAEVAGNQHGIDTSDVRMRWGLFPLQSARV